MRVDTKVYLLFQYEKLITVFSKLIKVFSKLIIY